MRFLASVVGIILVLAASGLSLRALGEGAAQPEDNEFFGTSTALKDGNPNDIYTGACAPWAGGGAPVFVAPYDTMPNAVGQYVKDQFVDKGYGTNYMTTWFMSRTAPKLETTATATDTTITYPAGAKIKGLGGALGPLTSRDVDNAYISSSVIPIMGDSNVGDANEAFLTVDIPDFLPKGSRLVESFNDGPHEAVAGTGKLNIWGSTTVTVQTMTYATGVSTGVFTDEQPATGTAIVYNHLQDYRDFGPVHGSGKGGLCNILFADGSVKSFTDINGDGYLNPGFQIPATATAADKAGMGYTDSTLELPRAQIFSGVFLQQTAGKMKLDP